MNVMTIFGWGWPSKEERKMKELSVLDELLRQEQEIIRMSGDDEEQHAAEDRAMRFFIEHCHEVSSMETVEIQDIFKRIGEMSFCRWYA